MEKKYLIVGMAVLLGASLSFFGCDDSTEEESPSTDAGLTSVLEQSITAGSEDGTKTAPKTASITVEPGVAAVKAGDIEVAEKAAAKLYSDAGFSTEADATTGITLTAGSKTDVYILVTAADGATKLHYTVSIERLETVTGYSLKASAAGGAADSESGLTISAVKNAAGAVTIRLGGTLKPAYVYTADGSTAYPTTEPTEGAGSAFEGMEMWIGSTITQTPKPAAGKYAEAYIGALFKGLDLTSKFIAVKQSNQALRFFTNMPSSDPRIVTTPLTAPKATDAEGAIYLPSDATVSPVRWRVYGQGAKTVTETFGILIWSGASPKTATFEITARASAASDAAEADTPYRATIVVDYSSVNFGD